MFTKHFNKKTNITVDFGAEQYSTKGDEQHRNAYSSFYDNNGHFVMILSDGMGDDDRAAVESKMAVDLIKQYAKQGTDYNLPLKILNSSLLEKSTDESLATVDIVSVDLCSGSTEFYKAGSAPSILCQNGKAKKVKSTSLPAGVLRDISFDTALVKCKVGDIIVLLTDGAISNGCDWIKDEILSFRDGNAQDWAEHLCMCARQQITDDCEEDITVLCTILNKAD